MTGGIVPPDLFQAVLFQAVLARRRGRGQARRERHRMPVPMGADVRRQDRPGHVGVAARKERCGGFHDVMLRREPGDEMRFLLAADFAKTDEACILC